MRIVITPSVVGLLLLVAIPVAAQPTIPLTLIRDGGERTRVSLRMRRGERVICEDDAGGGAPPCGTEIALPGPGTYVVEVEVTPIGEDARSYVYRLPIARDAIAASLALELAYTAFPHTGWLGSIWLDIERPGEADGMTIDFEGYLHVDRRVLWRYGVVSIERLDGELPPVALGRAWCGMGPQYGEPVWVEPDVPADLRGSSDRSLRTDGPTRITAVVHVPIALGSRADRPTERPRLRRTERRTVVRSPR